MLTQKRERELTKAAEEAEEMVNFLDKLPELNTHWYIFLLYLSSQNLVKHSKILTLLTIVLAVTAVGMIGLAIAQLVALLQQGSD